ncbi:Uu.00g004100.m01.CDS01 [Anthostomella pinea]|uniref:Uu.00g004100.m01.CDS01 n=1 Tax=Anthostomella pinea TaxID=933095 RepID=A0AAI8VL08_9PEZI|nr:Uu.00g004100.m01.CDS01 [Anthostomella pinea]
MAFWREMAAGDIEGLMRVAEVVHPGLPESDQVFAERVKLFPEGCLALVNDDEEVCGYAISHPIRNRQPPALDSLLGEVASDADQYYIHDVAILPKFRGRGLAAECVKKLLVVAERYSSACLISVYGTAAFWRRFGFVPGSVDEVLSAKVRGYGDDATYLVRSKGY